MNIKQKIFLTLLIGTAAQSYADANAEDSRRCSEQTLIMTAAEDGCSGDYCKRKAFVCMPTTWWTGQQVIIPSNAKAPLVLAFHGRGKENLATHVSDKKITEDIKEYIANAPEAGMFAVNTNLHGEMRGAIVIYFQGLPTTNSWAPAVEGTPSENNFPRGWQVNLGTDLSSNRDLTFVEKFLTTPITIGGNPLLLQNYIDKKQVYAVGHSNGSRFVGVLWNHSSTENPLQRSNFKGVAFSAAQAGDFPNQGNNIIGQNLFDQADPLSIFMGMGSKDITVNYTIQLQSIAKAKALLNTAPNATQTFPLAPGENLEIFENTDGLQLATYIHPDFVLQTIPPATTPVENGHVWPKYQEKKIAKFFGLKPLLEP